MKTYISELTDLELTQVVISMLQDAEDSLSFYANQVYGNRMGIPCEAQWEAETTICKIWRVLDEIYRRED